jgi:hypothetical protein
MTFTSSVRSCLSQRHRDETKRLTLSVSLSIESDTVSWGVESWFFATQPSRSANRFHVRTSRWDYAPWLDPVGRACAAASFSAATARSIELSPRPSRGFGVRS